MDDREAKLDEWRRDWAETWGSDSTSEEATHMHELLNEAYNLGAEQWSAKLAEAVRALVAISDQPAGDYPGGDPSCQLMARSALENLRK